MNFLHLTVCALIVCTHTYGFGINDINPFSSTPITKIQYQWRQLEFSFPTSHARQQARVCGNFKPSNAIPIDVQPHYDHKNYLRTFVTIPRFQDGIPFTLATVSKKVGGNGPLLHPYPNYEFHNNKNGTNCNAITSAFRVAIDECDKMWVMDSGSIGFNAQCAPQLLVFDLKTDKLIHRYRFGKSLYIPGASLFINPLVVVKDPAPKGSCQHTMVYAADVNYHGLVVYDFKQHKAWRIENRFMHPDPNHGLLSVAGDSFPLMDGIFGLATDKTNLYFHPLASAMEYAVSLKVIDNSTLFENNKGNMYEAFMPLGKRKSECGASAMDSNNNLYCVTLDPIELIVWNVYTPYYSYNIKKLKVSPDVLEFVSGMKVVRNHHGIEELWMISNRFQKMATGTQNFNEANFRIVVHSLENNYFFQFSRLGQAQQWGFD